jgi:hypothetical protein
MMRVPAFLLVLPSILPLPGEWCQDEPAGNGVLPFLCRAHGSETTPKWSWKVFALTATLRRPRDTLERGSDHIVGCSEGAPAIHFVHGDLWAGNLLSGPHCLWAIDFAEAGGPCTIWRPPCSAIQAFLTAT